MKMYQYFYANIITDFSHNAIITMLQNTKFFHCFTFKTAYFEKLLKRLASASEMSLSDAIFLKKFL